VADDGGLFDMDPVPLPPPPEKLSADRRRTIRQRETIAAGRHPLETVWPTYRHPETRGETYTPDDPRGRPYTCGSCRFRALLDYHRRTYAKCVEDDTAPRATHGAASDVRAWWPACRDYEAGDHALSRDAARSIPDPVSRETETTP
jgi:hypothetical protein